MIIPPSTSKKVCHNLSFSMWILPSKSKTPSSSSLILFRKLACCPASYLTFAASYQNKNEKVNDKANRAESYPYSINISVVMLAEIPLCTDGKPPPLHNALNHKSPCVARSITTLIHWIIHPMSKGIRKSGTIGRNRDFEVKTLVKLYNLYERGEWLQMLHKPIQWRLF